MRDRLVGALGLIGAALVAGFALRTWLLGGEVDDRGFALAVAAAVVLVAYAALARDEVAATARAPATRHAARSAGVVLLAAALAVGAYAGVRSVDRVWDLTARSRFTLSDHTLGVLAALDRDVALVGFFPHGSAAGRTFEALARRYAEHSPRITVAFHDPQREPLLAAQEGVTSPGGEALVKSGDRTERLITRLDEDALTSAIVRATSDEDHVVCWADGHGEPDPDDVRGRDGMGSAVLALERQNYQVIRASLLVERLDPRCEVLVVVRPTLPLGERAVGHVTDFVRRGGRALVLLEPGSGDDLAAGLSRFGVRVGDDVVLDRDPSRAPAGADEPAFLMIPPRDLRGNAITHGLAGAVVLAVARSVDLAEDTPGVVGRVILRAGPSSWAETEPHPDAVPDPHERRGDIPLGVVVEVTDPALLGADDQATPGGRLIVLGDAGFAANPGVDFGSNLQLFLDSIAWLAAEEHQMGSRPTDLGERLPITARGELLTALVGLLLAPGLAAALGIRAWWRRRGG